MLSDFISELESFRKKMLSLSREEYAALQNKLRRDRHRRPGKFRPRYSRRIQAIAIGFRGESFKRTYRSYGKFKANFVDDFSKVKFNVSHMDVCIDDLRRLNVWDTEGEFEFTADLRSALKLACADIENQIEDEDSMLNVYYS